MQVMTLHYITLSTSLFYPRLKYFPQLLILITPCVNLYKIITADYKVFSDIISRVEAIWNVTAHAAQKPNFVFQRNGWAHLNRRGRKFSRLLAAKACASAVVMLDTPCSEVMWGVLATHSIRQFPLHFPSPASPCAITFQLESTNTNNHSISYTTTL